MHGFSSEHTTVRDYVCPNMQKCSYFFAESKKKSSYFLSELKKPGACSWHNHATCAENVKNYFMKTNNK